MEYSINFTKQGKKSRFSQHYKGDNRYLFVKGVKVYQLKPIFFQLNACLVCFRNISKDFAVDNMKEIIKSRN